mmetsp:Transcript_22439/g.54612  ORF Transcript_22439/g.54612 Transcript_22439/m.54612 type:complete len:260 (+) Transcript_22439:228-1007(+)
MPGRDHQPHHPLLPLEARDQKLCRPRVESVRARAVVPPLREDADRLGPPVLLHQPLAVVRRHQRVVLRVRDQHGGLAVLGRRHDVDLVKVKPRPCQHGGAQRVDGALDHVAHGEEGHVGEEGHPPDVPLRAVSQHAAHRRVAAIEHHAGDEVIVPVARRDHERRGRPHAPPVERYPRHALQTRQVVQHALEVCALQPTQRDPVAPAHTAPLKVEGEEGEPPREVLVHQVVRVQPAPAVPVQVHHARCRRQGQVAVFRLA